MKIWLLTITFLLTQKVFSQRFSKAHSDQIANIIRENSSYNTDTLKNVETDSITEIITKHAACLGLAIRELGEVYIENKIAKETTRYFFCEHELVKIEVYKNEGFKEYYYQHWKFVWHNDDNRTANMYVDAAKRYMKVISKSYRR